MDEQIKVDAGKAESGQPGGEPSSPAAHIPRTGTASSSSSSSSSSEGGFPGVSWGIFQGVVVPSLILTFPLLLFLRANLVLGEAGVLNMLGLVVLVHSLMLLSLLTFAAIATNVQVRGGGAYYVVSRVLGPEFGASTGLTLFCMHTTAAAMCLIGLADILVAAYPVLAVYRLYIVLLGVVLVSLGISVRSTWLPRANVLFLLLILGLLVLAFVAAVQHFTPEGLAKNWGSQYTPISSGGTSTFWGAFALFLPVAAGILVPINSGYALKKPERSIPVGLLLFFAASLAVAATWAVLLGGAYTRQDLVNEPFGVFFLVPVPGGKILALVAMATAALGGTLGNLLGAGAVLQSVARDGLVPVVRVFGKTRTDAGTPRKTIWIASLGVIFVVALLYRTPTHLQFDTVTRVLSRLVLYTLGMVNTAAFFEAFLQTPNFRPRFGLFHWWTALVGAVGCLGIVLVLRPVEAVVVVILLTGLTWFTKKRELDEAFGDAERGFLYKAARNNLVKLSYKGRPQSWRPTSLVFSGNPETRETLVSYAVWLSAGRGVVFLANILVGTLQQYAPHRDAVAQRLREFCAWKRIQAFPIVVVAQDLLQGVSSILQTVSLGPIRPNVAVFGWTGDSGRIHVAAEQYRLAKAMDMSVVVVHGDERPFFYDRKRIDIWWRNDRHGRLMFLLAHLLRQNWEWAHMNLRILRPVDSPGAAQGARVNLEKTIADAGIPAEIEVLVATEEPFATVFHKYSADADCIFLDFDVPSPEEEISWYEMHERLLREMPPTVLVNSEAPDNVLE